MQHAQRWLCEHHCPNLYSLNSFWLRFLMVADLWRPSQEGHVQHSFCYVFTASLLIRATFYSRLSHLEVTVTKGSLRPWEKIRHMTDIWERGKNNLKNLRRLWVSSFSELRRNMGAEGSKNPEQINGVKSFCCQELIQTSAHDAHLYAVLRKDNFPIFA